MDRGYRANERYVLPLVGSASFDIFFLAGRIFESFGLLLSAYLLSLHMYRAVPICGMGLKCDRLVSGNLSEIGRVPVALIGLIGFTLLTLTSIVSTIEEFHVHDSWPLVHRNLARTGLLFSMVLTGVGFFWERTFCPWCVGVLICIFVVERLATIRLRIPSKPNFLSAILASMLLSISGVCSLWLFQNQQGISLKSPITTGQLAPYKSSELIGGFAGNGVSSMRRNTTYVCLYEPGCGGCIRSMESILGRGVPVQFAARFYCADDQPEFEFTSLLQAITGEPQGPKLALKYLLQSNGLLTEKSLLAYCVNNRTVPTPLQRVNARRYVRSTANLVRKLNLMGFPTVIKVTDTEVTRCVNPITLADFSGGSG